MVGQDLIAAAATRAQISQIERFNTAVNTFFLKYNALPGDMLPTNAAANGFAARAGGPGRGNGDEKLGSGAQYDAGSSSVAGETALFWNDLSTAGLIEGNYQGIDCAAPPPSVVCTASSATMPVNAIIPTAKIGNNNYVFVYYDPLIENANVYQILAMTGIASTGEMVGAAQGMTHRQAFVIDTKIDDGLPETGIVVSRRENTHFAQAPFAGYKWGATGGECGVPNDGTNYGSPSAYNLSYEKNGLIYGCSISIRFQ